MISKKLAVPLSIILLFCFSSTSIAGSLHFGIIDAIEDQIDELREKKSSIPSPSDVVILWFDYGKISNYGISVWGEVQNNASRPCDVDITASAYLTEDPTQVNTGTETFYVEAYQTREFHEYYYVTLPGNDPTASYFVTVEITDVNFY